MMRHSYIVISNAERHRVSRGWKDASGNAQFDHESLGYFLTLSDGSLEGNITFRTPERQSFSPGDTVWLTLERDAP